MQKNQTNYLTYGSMMIALFAILLAVSIYIPVIRIVTVFIVPLPIAWYSAKFDRRQAILVTILSVVISYFIGGIFGLLAGILAAPLGLIIGNSIQNNKSKLHILMSSGIFLLVMTALQYIISIFVLNMNIIENLLEGLEITYTQARNIMSSVGQLPKGYDELFSQALLLFRSTLPFYFIGTAFVTALVYVMINLSILKKLKIDVPKFSKFMDFRLPKVVLWYYLIVSIITLFVSYEVGTFGYLLVVNALLILRVLLFLQGISFIHYLFYVQGWPKWATTFATILAIPLITFTIILGVLDLGFNLRAFLKDRYKK